MSNEIKTRYLIVEIPRCAAEEIDTVADVIQQELISMGADEPTVHHVLAETEPPVDIEQRIWPDGLITVLNDDTGSLIEMAPYDWRLLVGHLIVGHGVHRMEAPAPEDVDR